MGDVNGDGFSDFLIGAPSADAANNAKPNAGETYLLYGGRRASGVTIQGSASSETLSGSSANDIINGSRSNDTLISAGGADVLFGGQGNDVFDISDLSFRQINGGSGIDTLRLSSSASTLDMTLDLTMLANNRLRSIEQIDLRGAGSNTLRLNALELLNLSDESNTLVVYRDAADTIDFGNGWTTGVTETIGQDLFQIYTQGAATLKVQIPNQAPTGIQLTNVVTQLPENTNTASPIKLADIRILDDAQGTNTLSLTGPDAANFEIISTPTGPELYLRAGVALSFATQSAYNLTINVDDSTVGGPIDATFAYSLNLTSVNAPVVLTVNNAQVTGTVSTTLTNTGTWHDPEGGEVTLTASIGTITKNASGTWSWTHTPNNASESQIVTINAEDGTHPSSITFHIRVNVAASVVNRRVFYNQSFYDGNNALVNANDANAIATDKVALLPGERASAANYTNYSRGINGIIIDIAGDDVAPTLADFEFRVGNNQLPSNWALAPPVASFSVTPSGGANGSQRVTITFASGAIRNTWLQVKILNSPRTKLSRPDVFYFGNQVGDTFNEVNSTRVNSLDFSLVQSNYSGFSAIPLTNRFDIDKNGRVNALDASIVQASYSGFSSIIMLTAPTT